MTATTQDRLDFEGTLNPEQLAAVTHRDGPQLVIAGAGSGKTRVITYRIAWLVKKQNVDAGAIAAVTFTNKAAAEMRERIEELLGLYPLPSFVGTFHRFALRLLRRYGPKVDLPRDFSILDSSDQLSLIKKAQKAAQVPEDAFRPRAILSAISSAKNQLVGPAQYGREADEFFSRKVASVYQHYQSLLRESSGVDFDDMIRLSVQLLRKDDGIRRRTQERFPHLLVDEFQDTNHAQLELVKLVAGAEARLTAVGDEDQSIYRWRGADLRNVLQFEESFPEATVRKLERNYRSTQTILDASGAVVSHNCGRRGKRLWTDVGAGDKIVLFRGRDEKDEARWVVNTLDELRRDGGGGDGPSDGIPWHDMAVLVRTNAQTRALEEELLRRGLRYNLVAGVRFYERAEIKDLVAYLRLLRNPDDVLSFERVLNRPPRGIGQKTRGLLTKIAERGSMTPWQALSDDTRLAGLDARARSSLVKFRTLVTELRHLADDLPLPALLRQLLEATDYLDQFDDSDEDDRSRLENIEELLSAAQSFTEETAYRDSAMEDSLSAFLDHVALASDTDALGESGLSLMTLHSAKGLEFSAVVVAGLEEGLLPHFNSQALEEDLEEERRLLYVGMTRAKRRLFLTTCKRRRQAGQYQDQEESRFLAEVPGGHVVAEHSPELFQTTRGAGYGFGSGRSGGYGSYGSGFGSHGSDGTSSRSEQDIYSFLGKKPKAAKRDDPRITKPLREPDRPANLRLPFDPTTPIGGTPKKGSRVRHEKLGLGKVLQIEGQGDAAKLIVYFDSVGRRKLIAKYANLDVL
ncbi:MAG: UvrD-helicase domain-containing protein [Thermoanaerobaculia bacterium]|nr:UvrD-helicase domain-containing protein [Thermoanaerobaculia bacterium]